ncbi:MAG: nitric oxide-sensing protein NosP [Methylomonas sp.]
MPDRSLSDPGTMRYAQSFALEPTLAVQELYGDLSMPDMAFMIFFCSARYDRSLLSAAIKRQFGDVQTVGCTTAGEIGPSGLLQHSLVGVSFSSRCFQASAGLLRDLRHFSTSQATLLTQDLLQKLESQALSANSGNCFALLLSDALSAKEEPVALALQNELGKIPMIGGSAGDDLQFVETQVYFAGQFRSNCAVLLLVTTTLPFTIFKIQHFLPTEVRMVVTAANVAERRVMEINGLPAAQEYARLLGVGVGELTPALFATSPVVVMIDNVCYVRSIQRVNPDDSLSFYCAIEEGLVLRVVRGLNMVESLQLAFADINARIGRPQLTLACDCILRKLEVAQTGANEQVNELLQANHVVGFNTYGEQFKGVHVNQTLVGIAFGPADTTVNHD